MKKTRGTSSKDRKRLVKALDRAFSQYIRQRDGNKCVLCGSTKMVQCGHILSRVSYATRWDERNAHAQCAACNMKHEYNSYPFVSWALANVGKDAMDELQAMWNKPKQMTNADLQERLDELKRKMQ